MLTFQKSRQHGDKETEASQNNGFAKTTLAEHKVASSFVVQDTVRNVTIKPETTKRQDDITVRLPHYTSYTSPRMMKAQAYVQDSTMSSQKNVPAKVSNIYKWDCHWWDNSQADSQSVRPSVCPSIRQSVSWSASPPVSQSVSESFGGSVIQTVSQPRCSVKQSVIHSVNQVDNQSGRQSVSHADSRSVI